MTHRRADRVAFATSRRAVCLEMEVDVAGVKVDDAIRKLIKVAEDQGWTVRLSKANSGRLKWYDADGNLRSSTPTGGVGRTAQNVRAQLRKAGLNVDGVSEERTDETFEVDLEEDVITPEQALEVLMEHFTSAPTVDLSAVEALRDQVEAWKASSHEFQAELTKSQQREAQLRKQVSDQAALLQSLGDAFELPVTQILGKLADLLGVKV